MSATGYYIHRVDMSEWLDSAQRAIFVKNKVRKELWQELTDIILFHPRGDREDYFRIPHTLFVAIQTFCLLDGKGETVSNDQLLNFCTTLDSLRTRLSRMFREEVVEEKSPPVSPTVRTSVASGRIVRTVTEPVEESVGVLEQEED